MDHRGPDDSGVFSSPELSLGMTRLAILDLSPLGHQPMQSHCGRYWIVYNGECYNFKEVKKVLEASGDTFRSNSDTEVVLQSFVKWGTSCVDRLNGMFAFAIWDTFERRLFVVRDRLGIKPFYFCSNEHGFLFSSEIKSLLSSGMVDFRPEAHSIFEYFVFGHIQQPGTVAVGVNALMPGHFLSWQDGEFEIRRYWRPGGGDHCNLTYEDAKTTLLEKIRTSVRMQMVSDRPVGLFLSGGLDSASVLAAMAFNGAATHTFSMGFEANSYAKNEEKGARELAEHFGAEHEQINLDSATVLQEIPRFFQSLDQLSVDGFNTYLVSKFASKRMVVALSGLGGDELFAGYSRHAMLLWKARHRKLQWLSRMLPLRAILGLPSSVARILWRARAFGESDNCLLNYTFSRSLRPPNTSLELFSSKLLQSVNVYNTYLSTYGKISQDYPDGSLNAILNLDLYGFMSSVLLRDMDATSMAHSLEVRFPLLDHELVEFAFRLPEHYKLRRLNQRRPSGEGTYSYKASGAKRILMDSIEHLLPAHFGDRPKNGFKLPIDFWLKQVRPNELKAMVFDERGVWEDFLDSKVVEFVFLNFLNGKENGNILWSILSFVGVLRSLRRATEVNAGERDTSRRLAN